MKRIILSALIIILAANLSTIAQDQFTAKDALTDVISRAKFEGISDPVLTGIGIAPGEYTIPGLGTINPKMDITTGKSPIWLYMVAEKTDNTKSISIAALKLFSGFVAMKVNIDISSIPIKFFEPITVDWINSDILCQKLNENTAYSNFIKNGTIKFDFSALDYEDSNELKNWSSLPVGPYWITGCSSSTNESIICYTDAVTGETNCLTTTDVNDNTSTKNSFAIFPNPAKDKLIVEKNDLSGDLQSIAFVIDSRGFIIEKYNLEKTATNAVDIQNLPDGTYTLLIGNSFKRFIKIK